METEKKKPIAILLAALALIYGGLVIVSFRLAHLADRPRAVVAPAASGADEQNEKEEKLLEPINVFTKDNENHQNANY